MREMCRGLWEDKVLRITIKALCVVIVMFMALIPWSIHQDTLRHRELYATWAGLESYWEQAVTYWDGEQFKSIDEAIYWVSFEDNLIAHGFVFIPENELWRNDYQRNAMFSYFRTLDWMREAIHLTS